MEPSKIDLHLSLASPSSFPQININADACLIHLSPQETPFPTPITTPFLTSPTVPTLLPNFRSIFKIKPTLNNRCSWFRDLPHRCSQAVYPSTLSPRTEHSSGSSAATPDATMWVRPHTLQPPTLLTKPEYWRPIALQFGWNVTALHLFHGIKPHFRILHYTSQLAALRTGKRSLIKLNSIKTHLPRNLKTLLSPNFTIKTHVSAADNDSGLCRLICCGESWILERPWFLHGNSMFRVVIAGSGFKIVIRSKMGKWA